MSAAENGQHHYKVHCSRAIAEGIRDLHRQAARSGQGHTVTRAFERILQRLKSDPNAVGEPSYRLPALKMHIRVTVVPPLVVHFAVCEDKPLVFIKAVELLS